METQTIKKDKIFYVNKKWYRGENCMGNMFFHSIIAYTLLRKKDK